MESTNVEIDKIWIVAEGQFSSGRQSLAIYNKATEDDVAVVELRNDGDWDREGFVKLRRESIRDPEGVLVLEPLVLEPLDRFEIRLRQTSGYSKIRSAIVWGTTDRDDRPQFIASSRDIVLEQEDSHTFRLQNGMVQHYHPLRSDSLVSTGSVDRIDVVIETAYKSFWNFGGEGSHPNLFMFVVATKRR